MSTRKGRHGMMCTALVLFFAWLFQVIFGWGWWPAFGLAVPCSVIAGIVILAAGDIVMATLPRPVPPELAARVAVSMSSGCRKARVHPWWSCDRRLQPHVHMVCRDSGRRQTFIIRA
jgi:hypothetical protein